MKTPRFTEPEQFRAAIQDYVDDKLTRGGVMAAVGTKWYGDVLELMKILSIEFNQVDPKIINEQAAAFVEILKDAGETI